MAEKGEGGIHLAPPHGLPAALAAPDGSAEVAALHHHLIQRAGRQAFRRIGKQLRRQSQVIGQESVEQSAPLADTGPAAECLHVIGGGCRNRLLNRLTEEATGIPVLAGPVEATAIGNLLVQAEACGKIKNKNEIQIII